jgi:hypothetical protein
MVELDAAAINARIGPFAGPTPAPSYRATLPEPQPREAKWRRALRPRSA